MLDLRKSEVKAQVLPEPHVNDFIMPPVWSPYKTVRPTLSLSASTPSVDAGRSPFLTYESAESADRSSAMLCMRIAARRLAKDANGCSAND